LEEGVAGRETESKVLVVIAAEADGPGIGRIRMRVIEDASAASLHPFVQDCVEPGSTLHTDGWQGYSGLDKKGYQREVTLLRGRRKEASILMPRVHRIAGLLKRWLLGTHQGAVAPQHLSLFPAHAAVSRHLSEDLRHLNRPLQIRKADGTTGWGRVSQGDTRN